MRYLIKILPWIFVFCAGFFIRSLFIKPIIETVIKTDTIYDTTLITENINIVKPIYIKTVITDTIIDTVEVIREYYTKKYYNDTLKNDSVAYINVQDTIWKNEIISRRLNYINRKPITLTTQVTSIKQSNAGLYFGVTLSQSSLEPTISILKRNNSIYSIGVDITKLTPECIYGLNLGYSKRFIKFK